VQFRQYLAGVQQRVGIERAFELLLAGEVGFGELVFHQVALLRAHPVLTDQHAADIDVEAEDVGTEFLSAFDFAGLIRVVEDPLEQYSMRYTLDV
jgi:hypothetical protein